MNFGDILDNNSCFGGGCARIINDLSNSKENNMSTRGVIAQPSILSQSLSTTMPMLHSAGLSLAIQNSLEGQGEVSRMGENNYELSSNKNNNDNIVICCKRSRDEDHESRSVSNNGASGDDDQDFANDDLEDKPASRKKRYHRHTPHQIQELEALFKECPHPDEKQRLELSKRLCLDTRQVKFWFQNRRTQMKTQLERHENSILRQENDKLRAQNMSMREAMQNPICTNCGGPASIGEISMEEQHLRIENARLKDELDHICALVGKFLEGPLSSVGPNSSLELGTTNNINYGGLKTIISSSLPSGLNDGISGSVPLGIPKEDVPPPLERSMYLELALAAMDELVKMAQSDEPLWVKSQEDGREMC